MYNEANYSDKNAIQHLADEIAIQNMLNVYINKPDMLRLEERIIIMEALKAHLLMNAELIIEKLENGFESGNGKIYKK